MKRIPIFAVIAVLAFSCSEDPEVIPLTYTKVFSGENEKTWVIDKVLVRKDGEEEQEFEFFPCELDDRYTFKADEQRTFTVSNGNIKCEDETEDIYVDDTWSFVNSGAVLTIAVPRIFGNFYIPFIVKEVTKDRLVLDIYADAENTISYRIVMRSVSEQ
jgi:hypothetical protein